LVAVLHTRKKKYLIDSVPGLHKDEALMVLGRLEAHLLAEHSFDISEYEVGIQKFYLTITAVIADFTWYFISSASS
jgi:hypothetical protein